MSLCPRYRLNYLLRYCSVVCRNLAMQTWLDLCDGQQVFMLIEIKNVKRMSYVLVGTTDVEPIHQVVVLCVGISFGRTQ